VQADLDGDGELDFNEFLCIQRHALMSVPTRDDVAEFPPGRAVVARASPHRG